MADRGLFIGAAGQLWNVAGDGIVNAVDRAILKRGAHQHRGHRLDRRHRGPSILWLQTQAIALQHDVAVTDDEQACHIVAIHEVVHATPHAFGNIAHVDLGAAA
jgi:hypothetical protein